MGNRLKSASRGFVVVGIVVLAGCHAKQVTEQFSVGFDQAIGRLYETHVLNNLARCDNDEFFVQMTFGNFGSDLTRTGSLSAQVVLWGNRTNPDSDQEVLFGLFEQSYSPTVSQSQSARLGFTASPASGQSAILAMYRGEVERPTEERFFRVTHKLAERLNAYCSTRRGIDEWCVVPQDRRREFCEFVHRVSFYEPPAATQPAVPDGAAASDASAAP